MYFCHKGFPNPVPRWDLGCAFPSTSCYECRKALRFFRFSCQIQRHLRIEPMIVYAPIIELRYHIQFPDLQCLKGFLTMPMSSPRFHNFFTNKALELKLKIQNEANCFIEEMGGGHFVKKGTFSLIAKSWGTRALIAPGSYVSEFEWLNYSIHSFDTCIYAGINFPENFENPPMKFRLNQKLG